MGDRSYKRYWDDKERQAKLRGFSASFDGRVLKLFKDGNPFEDFQVSATSDWKAGVFSIQNGVLFQWEPSRKGKKKFPSDCWAFWGKTIAEYVNIYGKGRGV